MGMGGRGLGWELLVCLPSSPPTSVVSLVFLFLCFGVIVFPASLAVTDDRVNTLFAVFDMMLFSLLCSVSTFPYSLFFLKSSPPSSTVRMTDVGCAITSNRRRAGESHLGHVGDCDESFRSADVKWLTQCVIIPTILWRRITELGKKE